MEIQPLVILGVQLATALGISLVVIHLIQPALEPLLGEVCGSEAAARFWVNFTRLMVLIAPLLQVILLAAEHGGMGSVELIRGTLFHALGGVFLALSVIGLVIWKVALTDRARSAAGGE